MLNPKRLFGYLATGVMPEVTALDESLAEHDKRFHPDGFDPDADRCSKRDASESDDESDDLAKGGDRHDLSMTPSDCEKMIRRAFIVAGIKSYGEYKTPEDWFKGEGPNGVAEIVDNYRELYDQFVRPIENDIDSIQDVLESYSKGTLVGPRNDCGQKGTGKIDLGRSRELVDKRFYAAQSEVSSDPKSDWIKACEKSAGKNKSSVEAARGRILMFAHNKGAIQSIGITQKELNARLRSWSAYPASSLSLSQRLNEGVADSAKWTGLENMSCLSSYLARGRDLSGLVKKIDGDPSQFQKDYITRTMLALDTHIDYSGLSFEFTDGRIGVQGHEHCNGVYRQSSRSIQVKNYAPNTVAHEMGHFIDDQWGRELGYSYHLSEKPRDQVSDAYKNKDEDVNLFMDHFDSFMESLDEVADETSGYTLDRGEIFARFVSKFVQWTERQARGSRAVFGGEDHYRDRFDSRHYVDFVRLLQEKAWLDANGKTKKA